jgi:hypothetical protein
MRSALFWDFTQRRMVIAYRRFGSIDCLDTPVRIYNFTLREIPKEHRYRLHSGGRLKSLKVAIRLQMLAKNPQY